MFDKIVECLPSNLETFWFIFRNDVSMVNASTMSNILKLQNLENLQDFIFYDCPDTLNVEDLSVFIKKFENTKMYLAFDGDISQEYKEQLDSLVDNIIESDLPNRVIAYVGQDREKLMIMISRFDLNGLVPFNIPDEDDEDEDGSDVENEAVVDDKLESDAGSTGCIALLWNKIKNLFM